MQREAFDALIARARAAVDGAGASPAARLRAFLRNHVGYFAEHPDLMRVLVHEAAALPERSRAHIRRRKERYFELARALVAEVMHGRPAADVERATYCAFGMLNWTYAWYQPAQHGSPDELSDTIFNILSSGLPAASEGHA
jgi:hypothetical protein